MSFSARVECVREIVDVLQIETVVNESRRARIKLIKMQPCLKTLD